MCFALGTVNFAPSCNHIQCGVCTVNTIRLDFVFSVHSLESKSNASSCMKMLKIVNF